MAYNRQPLIPQILTMVVALIILLLGGLVDRADNLWNENKYEIDRLEFLRQKYKYPKPFNFEQQIIIENNVVRDTDREEIGLVFVLVGLILSFIHFYLCFLIKTLYYRKNINIWFHCCLAVLLFVGSSVYFGSVAFTNNLYNRHFEILYERVPSNKIPWNPCKFPQSEWNILKTITGQPYACHDSWTKIIVIFLGFINVGLYISTACVVNCFVEEENLLELFYKDLEIENGGPLPPVSQLPPLPYYCRPISESPTNKKRKIQKKINRVEVSENWTTPPRITLEDSD